MSGEVPEGGKGPRMDANGREGAGDTPRTDQWSAVPGKEILAGYNRLFYPQIDTEFARQLERELNQAKKNEGELSAECHSKMQEINELKQRLVEARECLREALKEAESVPDLCLEATISARWRKAAGIEDAS